MSHPKTFISAAFLKQRQNLFFENDENRERKSENRKKNHCMLHQANPPPAFSTNQQRKKAQKKLKTKTLKTDTEPAKTETRHHETRKKNHCMTHQANPPPASRTN